MLVQENGESAVDGGCRELGANIVADSTSEGSDL
jgi:hypothetical protein